MYWPPKKYQDKNKKTLKVWNLIVVGLANKQCAIVLRFSPKWEQVAWFEQIMTRETPFLDAVWKPLQYLQWNTSLSADGSKNDKQTDVKNKRQIIALWKTAFM